MATDPATVTEDSLAGLAALTSAMAHVDSPLPSSCAASSQPQPQSQLSQQQQQQQLSSSGAISPTSAPLVTPSKQHTTRSKSKLAEHVATAATPESDTNTTGPPTSTTLTTKARQQPPQDPQQQQQQQQPIDSVTKRKRALVQTMRSEAAYEPIDRRSCNCKNSRCLKLYCECFPATDHAILTSRGFLCLEDVLRSVTRDAHGTIVDWRGLTVATFEPTAQRLVYRQPRRVVVNAPGAAVVQFCDSARAIDVVATRAHQLFVMPRDGVAFSKATSEHVAQYDAVHFLCAASGGVEPLDHWRQLAWVQRLALVDRAQMQAFLSLYGLWLANGSFAVNASGLVCLTFDECAPSLLQALCARSGLMPAVDFCDSQVHKQSWLDLFQAHWPHTLLDGLLTHFDKSLLQCVVRNSCTLPAASVELRDQLLQLATHAGFSATFAAAPQSWLVQFDAAHERPLVELNSGTVREFVCNDETWCFDMDDGFVVVRRDVRKAGVTVAASRPTIQGNCFTARVYCNNCACIGCQNTPEHEQVVAKAIGDTQERNPTAFSSDDKAAKGCNCKKSFCLKKYCECFQAGIACSRNCRCVECKNNNPPHASSSTGTPPPPPPPVAKVSTAATRRLSSSTAALELAADTPLMAAVADENAVYLSAAQVAAHTVAREWAEEAVLVDVAQQLIKRARTAVDDVSSAAATSSTVSAAVIASPLDSVASAIRESGEVRGASAAGDQMYATQSYARYERAVLGGVRALLEKSLNDLSRI